MANRPACAFLVTLVDYFNERPHAHLSVLAVEKNRGRQRRRLGVARCVANSVGAGAGDRIA